jgi:hypothetical protein
MKWIYAFIVLCCAGVAASASAQTVTADFGPTTLNLPAGSSFTINGTVTNNTGQTAYLNGFHAELPGADSLDESPFLSNAPFQLSDGETSGPFDFFQFTLPGDAIGSYNGFFTILGGLENVNPGANDALFTGNFTVTVPSTTDVVPEGGSLPLLLAGLLVPVGVAFRRRSRRHLRTVPCPLG